MNLIEKLKARITTRTQTARQTAAETWNRLAQKVFESGGELTEKEIEALEQAAEALEIADYPERFSADVEELRAKKARQENEALRRQTLPEHRKAVAKKFDAARAFLAACEAERQILAKCRTGTALVEDFSPMRVIELQTGFITQSTLEANLKAALDNVADAFNQYCGTHK
jgi:vacuolar-type H+-ATPase subunit C/Vma6